MAYIGNTPADSYISLAVQHFTVSATLSYTLDQAVTNSHDIALFINNVRQEPGSGYAYTASGGTLTLSAPTATTDTMYCVFLGKSIGTIAPPADSIGTSAIADAAITDAKIGTVGASKITGTVADSQIAGMAASKLTGTVTNTQIADLDAAKLTGTVADARFPATLPASSGANLTALTAGNITGVIPTANLGTGTANATTFLNGSGAYSEAGGGAFTLIATSLISTNTSAITLTGMSSTYSSYMLTFSDMIGSANNSEIRLRVGDATDIDYGLGDYSWHTTTKDAGGGSQGTLYGNDGWWALTTGGTGIDGTEVSGGILYFHNSPSVGASRRFLMSGTYVFSDSASASSTIGHSIIGHYDGGKTVDRVHFEFAGQNVASGRMSLYGIAHA